MLRSEILGLYKSLLRYSETLRLTDKKYFVHRVRKDFLKNRELTDQSKIEFQYKVIICCRNVFLPLNNICTVSLTKYHRLQKGHALLKYKRVV